MVDAEAENNAQQPQHLCFIGNSKLRRQRIQSEAAHGSARCRQTGKKESAGLEQLAADVAEPILEYTTGVDAFFTIVAAAR